MSSYKELVMARALHDIRWEVKEGEAGDTDKIAFRALTEVGLLVAPPTEDELQVAFEHDMEAD